MWLIQFSNLEPMNQIASILGVSVCTLRRRMFKYVFSIHDCLPIGITEGFWYLVGIVHQNGIIHSLPLSLPSSNFAVFAPYRLYPHVQNRPCGGGGRRDVSHKYHCRGPDMLVTVIQFYICFYLYIHLHNNDSVYNLEPDAHAQKSTTWLRDFRF